MTAEEILKLIYSTEDYTAVYGTRKDFYPYDADFSHSRDYDNFYFGMEKIVEYSQDEKIILSLVKYIPDFQKEIDKREYISIWAPDQNAYAMRILEYYKNHEGCSCGVYVATYVNPADNFHRQGKWQMIDPEKEAEKGYIMIDEMPHRISEQEFSFDYKVTCNKCGQKYLVGDREYHYRWWDWQKI